MITFKQIGDFSKTMSFFQRISKPIRTSTIEKYAKQGLEALKNATPVDSGVTASSWYYRIEDDKGIISITYYNSNVNDGVPIAIILQYGHATRNGGWVQGRDYINPAIQPIFDQIAADAWKEVVSR